jgi:hypothetical protein
MELSVEIVPSHQQATVGSDRCIVSAGEQSGSGHLGKSDSYRRGPGAPKGKPDSPQVSRAIGVIALA